MRVRKNVWKLPASDDTLTWYARGVAAMKQRPLSDPMSWRYQAAIHDYVDGDDPLGQPGDVPPPDADRFWRQCQHNSWYFLPWHRMYLHHFEAIVAVHVAAAGGPQDWALPYWNYSEGPASSLLPTAFRSPTLPDGTANPLYVAQRDEACNAGQPFADPTDVDVVHCLREPHFDALGQAGASSFGGPITQFEHSGPIAGALETTPHGNVHMAVGGDPSTGWMAAFHKAALDPIFWLHHCNIDRLWEVWLKRTNLDHANPRTNDWLRSVSFPFHDASGQIATMTPDQVLDTTAAPLLYQYDDTSDPLAPAAGAPRLAREVLMPSRQPPEMVGATQAPFDLAGVTTHATVPLLAAKATARTARLREASGGPRRVFLNVENITSTGRPSSYDVYLNVPDGDDPRQHADLHVGRLPMFGVAEASRASGKHAGSGLHHALDATELYERLSTQPRFDATKVRVSFVPARAKPGATVRIGRVSLYFE